MRGSARGGRRPLLEILAEREGFERKGRGGLAPRESRPCVARAPQRSRPQPLPWERGLRSLPLRSRSRSRTSGSPLGLLVPLQLSPLWDCFEEVLWRRERDSNPRSLAGNRFSRPAPSTARPSLRAAIIARPSRPRNHAPEESRRPSRPWPPSLGTCRADAGAFPRPEVLACLRPTPPAFPDSRGSGRARRGTPIRRPRWRLRRGRGRFRRPEGR